MQRCSCFAACEATALFPIEVLYDIAGDAQGVIVILAVVLQRERKADS